MSNRVKREATFHLGWGAIVLAFLIAWALTTARPALAAVFGAGALASAAAWGWMSGWRLRGPVWRLPEKRTLTTAEEAQRESARKVRDAFIQLLHASARPATAKLQEIIGSLAADLKARPEPSHTLGMFIDLYTLREAKKEEDKIRASLEGETWDLVQDEKSEALRRYIAESALEKNTAQSIGTAFFSYYCHYRLLIVTSNHLAGLVGIDPDEDGRFAEWRQLDERFTVKLREVIALPELASQRDDFEEWITKWSSS